MNHGLMSGMFWAGVLLSSIPVLLGLAIAAFVFRAWLHERRQADQAAREEAQP